MVWSTGKNNPRRIYFRTEGCGFTLIELLCVIVIISVLIGLSTPRISRTAESYYFRSKAKQSEALYRYIERKAVLEKADYKIAFNFSEGTFRIYRKEGKREEDFKRCGDSLLNKSDFSGLEFEPGTDCPREIKFSSDGKITPSEIVFKGKKGQTAKLYTALSGEIGLEFEN